jgi:hypothetical protein
MKNEFFTLPNDGQTLLFGSPAELEKVAVCGFISESSPLSAASIAAILNEKPVVANPKI